MDMAENAWNAAQSELPKKIQKGLNVEWNFEFNYTRPKCWNAKICQHMKILKKPDFTGRLVSAWSSPCWLLLVHLLASKKTLMSCVCSASAPQRAELTNKPQPSAAKRKWWTKCEKMMKKWAWPAGRGPWHLVRPRDFAACCQARAVGVVIWVQSFVGM